MADPVTDPSRRARIPLVDLLRRAGLRGLVATLHDPGGSAGATAVGGVRVDSRLVTGGDLFVAVPGTRVDGAAFRCAPRCGPWPRATAT